VLLCSHRGRRYAALAEPMAGDRLPVGISGAAYYTLGGTRAVGRARPMAAHGPGHMQTYVAGMQPSTAGLN
jgi:hypothetical protein